ncbi:hypothetical protein NDU88_003568 [Pleurodeles waltl]|uniref:Uncharacterized protein n=1 Tax=Pleurodeles waltl TaxID=8319 RepID=A0AAV7UGI3_PLEWA|nr:hypothetical protein NDU88_003568 [Pleurodeles waltl]
MLENDICPFHLHVVPTGSNKKPETCCSDAPRHTMSHASARKDAAACHTDSHLSLGLLTFSKIEMKYRQADRTDAFRDILEDLEADYQPVVHMAIVRIRNACNSWELPVHGPVRPEPRRTSAGATQPGRPDPRGRDHGPAPRTEIADQRKSAAK